MDMHAGARASPYRRYLVFDEKRAIKVRCSYKTETRDNVMLTLKAPITKNRVKRRQ